MFLLVFHMDLPFFDIFFQKTAHRAENRLHFFPCYRIHTDVTEGIKGNHSDAFCRITTSTPGAGPSVSILLIDISQLHLLNYAALGRNDIGVFLSGNQQRISGGHDPLRLLHYLAECPRVKNTKTNNSIAGIPNHNAVRQ